MLGWNLVSSRIIAAKFNTNHRKIKLNVVQCYSPTNDTEEEKKEEFYQSLEETIRKCNRTDITVLMGDMNAKVGADNENHQRVMGKCGVGAMNENDELFANFCADHQMVIGGTIFPHKQCHKATWVSPDMRTRNQIDHICISQRFRRTLQDVRVKRGADAATDHHLVVCKVKLKLKKYGGKSSTGNRYNTRLFKDCIKKEEYHLQLTNRYEALQPADEDATVEEEWQQLKEVWNTTCLDTVGRRTRKHQEWITTETLAKVEIRKEAKDTVNRSKTRATKQRANAEYAKADRDVKTSARRDKRTYVESIAQEAEDAAQKGDMRALYNTTKKLTNKKNGGERPVKNKEGDTITDIENQMNRWVEHFKTLLNQDPPAHRADIPPAEEPLNININCPTKVEIQSAIKQMKNNKAPGPDNIPAEALKADVETSTEMLYSIISKIWEEEELPADWKEGHIVKIPKKGDLSQCDNYRGIMLLSAPGKVMNRVIYYKEYGQQWTRNYVTIKLDSEQRDLALIRLQHYE